MSNIFKRFLGSAGAANAASAANAAIAANAANAASTVGAANAASTANAAGTADAATTTSSWKLISFAKFSTSNWRQFSRSLGCKKMSGAVSQMGVAPRYLF